MTRLKTTLILLIHILAFAQAALKPPEITPLGNEDSEIIAKPGSSLTLTCQGDGPLLWNFSQADIEYRQLDKAPIAKTRGYISSIMITNIKYYDVGYINCLYQDVEDVEAASVYLFVDDDQNLLAPVKGHGLMIFSHAYKGMDYTFPCKPTSPNVEVKLLKNDKEIDPEEISMKYDIKKGYTIDHVVTTNAAHYVCSAKRGETTQQTYIILEVSAITMFSKPSIDVHSGLAATIGGVINLDCSYETEQSVYFHLNWTSPTDVIQSERSSINCSAFITPLRKKGFRCTINVRNVTKEDSGEYNCQVWNLNGSRSNNVTINVYGTEDRFLKIEPFSSNITAKKGDTALWVIKFDGFPSPTFQWQNPAREIILNTHSKSKYEVIEKSGELLLKVHNVDLVDMGNYTLKASNSYDELSETLTLIVEAAPSFVEIKSPNALLRHFYLGEVYEFVCTAKGYPPPEFIWYFLPCKAEDNCESKDFRLDVDTNLSQYSQKSYGSIYLNISQTGYLRCLSENKIGSFEQESFIKVLDFEDKTEEGFAINGPSQTVEGENVTILCAIDILEIDEPENTLIWLLDNVPISNSSDVEVMKKTTIWSHQSRLSFQNIKTEQSGEYSCKTAPDSDDFKSMNLLVKEYAPPKIIKTNLTNSLKTYSNSLLQEVKFYCIAEGTPEPIIKWFKNGTISQELWTNSRTNFSNDNKNLTIIHFTRADNGNYSCRAEDGRGRFDEHFQIMEILEAQTGLEIWMIIIIAVFVVLFILMSGLLAHKLYKDHKIKMKVRSLIENEFHEGQKGQINPELGINEQVSMLPYDNTYEFPRENLTLGIQLGAGAFGRVMKGEAKRIVDNEEVTNVAVKMVKISADETHLKALMSELKIMVHLGQHVNVVNLLGACTKNLIKKKELLVIVEYCKYGNLLNYLHQHRMQYVDQIDPESGMIDPSIQYVGQKKLLRYQPQLNYAALTFHYSANNSRTTSNGYQSFYDIQKEAIERMAELQDPPTYKSGACPDYPSGDDNKQQSISTEMSYMTNGTNTFGKRRSSDENIEGNYKGDYVVRDVKPIKTTDLLCWSFQIARGMDYLASRKVMHGDLAARNILLAENNVVKICDFGLARKLYEYKYKMTKQGTLLPVKWMAIETIYYGDYSIQSDIWSFGVVMWELFSLGKTPYPGMEADERFITMLNNGYRMDKPAYALSSTYDLMLECWSHEPSQRPTFTNLADRIGDMMEENQRKHYVDLNDRYFQTNLEMMKGREDYLSMMHSPNSTSNGKGSPGPHRPYQNIAHGLNSEYVPPMMANNEAYRNLGPEPKVQMLANNSGYMYMARSLPDGSEEEKEVKERDCNLKSEEDIEMGKRNEISGVSNVNYLTTVFMIPPPPDDDDDDEGCSLNSRRFRPRVLRHKNDSGVSSSTDSTFGDNDSKSSSPVEFQLNKSTIYEINEEEKSPRIYQNSHPIGGTTK